jgi:choline kinase
VSRRADHEVVLLSAGCSRRLAHLTREVPKSFLRVGGRRIIDRSLDTLEALGLERVTAIVGYRKEVFRREVGERRGKLAIRYVESSDFETTGHGWSFYQARDLLRAERRPILLLHADVVYDPSILERVLDAAAEDVIAVDDRFSRRTGDEVLVCGDAARITRIQKIGEAPRDVIGEVVGVNRWSAAFVADLLGFMDRFFAAHGRNHNWEPVVDAYLTGGGAFPLRAVTTGGLAWVNVNYEADLERAEAVAR